MSFLSAAVASNATSQSINTGSLVFNPIISLDSPESQIRQTPTIDTSSEFRDTSATGTARAKATLSTTGTGDGGEDEGFAPQAALGSPRQRSVLKGDLTSRPGGSFVAEATNYLLIAALGVGAYFVARRFA